MQLQLVRQQTIVLGFLSVVTVILRVKVLTEILQPFHQSLQPVAAEAAAVETLAPHPLFRRRHRLVFQEALAVEAVVGKALVAAAQAVQELQISPHRQDQAQ
jgi:hypothetical protein